MISSIESVVALVIGCITLGGLAASFFTAKGRREVKVEDILNKLDRCASKAEESIDMAKEASRLAKSFSEDAGHLRRELSDMEIASRKKDNQIIAAISEICAHLERMDPTIKPHESATRMVRPWESA